MVTKEVGNYILKTTSNAEMDELKTLMAMGCENADPETVARYFHSWTLKHPDNRVLQYYFPKEKYFVSRCEETNYALALLQYIGYLKC